ncbi:MAG TPA: trypsin-like serine protease [Myxococcota bacterium]|nr:trypsin-like serine protease [Myxococcota bacterium]
MPTQSIPAVPTADVRRPRARSSPCGRRDRAPGRTRRLLALGLLLGAFAASPAAGVLISTGDGTGNTTPPAADPGFAHVGSLNGLTGVYVRNGWVLTANHVGPGDITLLGAVWPAIPGSRVRFVNPDSTAADLIAFKLRERPPLPDLALPSGAPSPDTLVTIVGNGFNRGAATTWMGMDGWQWGSGRTIRWGTNRITQIDQTTLDTHAFWFSFDDLRGPIQGQHEADVVNGDSGGAVFTGSGASAELVGILFARAGFEGQPASTSLYGNAGVAADLAWYRDDILAVIDRPDCDDGLDDDGDGLVDYPNDPGCASPADTSERAAGLVCDNGLDDDGDGLIDYPADPGCLFSVDLNERGAAFECDNGLDDDGDGLVDYPADDGCLHPTNAIEAPEPGFAAGLLAASLALAFAGRPGSNDRGRDRARQASSSSSTR